MLGSEKRNLIRQKRLHVKVALLRDLRACHAPYFLVRTEQVHLACLRSDKTYDSNYGQMLFSKYVRPLTR